MRRGCLTVVVLLLAAVAAFVGWGLWLSGRPAATPRGGGGAFTRAGDCAEPAAFVAAASANGSSLETLDWAPFRRPERGWSIYAPVIAREIGAACPPASPGFAARLARWQAAHGLAADGVMSAQTFEPMRVVLMLRRPFVAATARGACPATPDASQLAAADLGEGYLRKPVSLRPGALRAYRAMVAEARAQVPALAAEPELLTVFSGFRPPDDEAARCADGGCGGPERANCSAHRTGLALDINVGSAPGQRPDSTDDANRRAMAGSPAYRWLVANAGRFGFVGYPFEPWHWEWTGEPISPAGGA